MSYVVDEDRVRELDNLTDLRVAAEDRFLQGIVTPADVMRWCAAADREREEVVEILRPVIRKYGASAVLDALKEIGVLQDEDIWAGYWG